MYAGVPKNAPLLVSGSESALGVEGPGSNLGGTVGALPSRSSVARASPKSSTLTRPSLAMSTLSGLKSRCTRPAACAAASPLPACRNASTISRGARSFSLSQRVRVRPSMNSIAMNTSSPRVPTSWTAMSVPPRKRRPFRTQKLKRYLAIQLRIVGSVDDAHPSAAKPAEDDVPAEHRARRHRNTRGRRGLGNGRIPVPAFRVRPGRSDAKGRRRVWRRLEKAGRGLVGSEQPLHLGAQLLVALAGTGEKRGAFIIWPLERRGEHRVDSPPALRVHEVSPGFSSLYSQALAFAHSRFTVIGAISSASAISSTFRPPK